MSPTGSLERDAALESIAKHGALGAAHLEIEALRDELAQANNYQDAIKSFVGVIREQVVIVGERNAALARIEAALALLPDADHGPRCSAWASMPVYLGPRDCDCILAAIRAALDAPTEPAPDLDVHPDAPTDPGTAEGSGKWIGDGMTINVPAGHDPPKRAPVDPLTAVRDRLDAAMRGMEPTL